MKAEATAKRKIEALERRRTIIDHLIEFIGSHPKAVDESALDHFAKLQYDFAIIRPRWDKANNGTVLRLEKWIDGVDPYERFEPYGNSGVMTINKSMIVSEDVTDVPDEKLCEMLDAIHYELIPEDFEEDDSEQS